MLACKKRKYQYQAKQPIKRIHTEFKLQGLRQAIQYLDLCGIVTLAMCSKDCYEMCMNYLAEDDQFAAQILAICAQWLENGTIVLSGFKAKWEHVYPNTECGDVEKWSEYYAFLSEFVDSQNECKRKTIVRSLGDISRRLSNYIEAVFNCGQFNALRDTRPDKLRDAYAANTQTHRDIIERFLLPMSTEDIKTFTYHRFYANFCGATPPANFSPPEVSRVMRCQGDMSKFPKLSCHISERTSVWLERSCAVTISTTQRLVLSSAPAELAEFQRSFYAMLLSSPSCCVKSIEIDAYEDVIQFYASLLMQLQGGKTKHIFLRKTPFTTKECVKHFERLVDGAFSRDASLVLEPSTRMTYNLRQLDDIAEDYLCHGAVLCYKALPKTQLSTAERRRGDT